MLGSNEMAPLWPATLTEPGLGHPPGLAREPFVLIDKANELNAEW